MSLNENIHFSQIPEMERPRSEFKTLYNHKTTFNAGELIPIMIDEVLPGDTYQINLTSLVRMMTPITPVMDMAHLSIYSFFVPNRLLWEHWRNLMGENTSTYWERKTEYSIPQIKAPAGGWQKGTIADHFGLPTKVDISVSALPFRAYAMIVNEWFRDQNLQQPCEISTGDATVQGVNTGGMENAAYVTDTQLGGKPFMRGKIHDYFTSALPNTQKGPDVLIPLGGITGNIPVRAVAGQTALTEQQDGRWGAPGEKPQPMSLGVPTGHGGPEWIDGQYKDGILNAYGAHTGLLQSSESGMNPNNPTSLTPVNLFAVTAQESSNNVGTIAMLRTAFAIQRQLEKDARGGTRYREIIKTNFGVQIADATVQIPEYLGGISTDIGMQQVIQTSGTEQSGTPQGNTSAYSLTIENSDIIDKSFDEHGYIIVLATVRPEHTYQYGIERMWSRKSRFDFYLPTFAYISEQAILNKEIYAQGNDQDEEAFGYQEAWAEYRYKPSQVTGALRSNYEQSLDIWHYADKYEALPTLTGDWIAETSKNVDRTIAVSEELEDQFIGDFAFNMTRYRAMPVYSVPGLIDHF